MDKALTEDLKREIREAEAFFRAPPEDVMAECGLPTNAPLTVLFGPDVESYIVKDGQNIRSDKSFSDDIAGILYEALKKKTLLYIPANIRESDDMWEGKALEVRLAPAAPEEMCETFLSAKKITEETGRQEGVQVFFGNGHWHASFTADGQDALRDPKRPNLYGRFFQYACAGTLNFQEFFPALFVKASAAEREPLTIDYIGPERIAYNPNSSMASLRGGNQDSSTRTIEPRLCLHAPYQPVYLTLAAVRHGLLSRGERLDGTGPHRMMTLDAAACLGGIFEETAANRTISGRAVDDPSDWFVAQHEEMERNGAPPVTRGKGGYLGMLKDTAENLKRYPVIPAELGAALLRESIADYRAYLSSPWTGTGFGRQYSEQERDSLLHELDEFEKTCGFQTSQHIVPRPA